jgi:hypothetical protein
MARLPVMKSPQSCRRLERRGNPTLAAIARAGGAFPKSPVNALL